jgi:hypothetical protein
MALGDIIKHVERRILDRHHHREHGDEFRRRLWRDRPHPPWYVREAEVGQSRGPADEGGEAEPRARRGRWVRRGSSRGLKTPARTADVRTEPSSHNGRW